MKQHIKSTPGICGGKPHIAGHRVRVQDIVVMHEYQGMDVDEVVYHLPSLTKADVYAALAYYYDHQSQIQQHIRDEEAFAWEVKAKTTSLVGRKLQERHGR